MQWAFYVCNDVPGKIQQIRVREIDIELKCQYSNDFVFDQNNIALRLCVDLNFKKRIVLYLDIKRRGRCYTLRCVH